MNKNLPTLAVKISFRTLSFAYSIILIVLLTLTRTKATHAQMTEAACWKFEGNFNATTLATFNGTAFGNATITAANPSPAGGQSLLLDGDADYLTVGNPIPQTGSYSKTMWVYRTGPNSDEEWENLYTSGDPGGAHALLIDPATTPANGLVVYHRGESGGVSHQFTGQAIPTGQWVHLAVVYDATAKTLVTYYNGTSIDTQSNMPALDTITDPDNIGAYAGMQSYFNGQLDDVCIYSSALSSEAVMSLANPSSNIVVNSLLGTGAPGICVLDDAIESANIDASVNGCAAGSAGMDTITFNVTGTINLDFALFIDSDVTINANNQITLDGGSATRHLWVESGTSTIRAMTMQNGAGTTDCERDVGDPQFIDCGGAVYVNPGATLTVDNSVLTGNTVGLSGEGGAIYNLGTITVSNSTLHNNAVSTATDSFSRGGALANFGTASIVNSTLSGNTAYDGGAVNNRGTAASLTISNSTFSGNNATGNGGGIYNADEQTGSRIVNIHNSTFSGNTAPASAGGAMINFATATIINSTFSGNAGGGLENWSAATVSNSIFANSTAGGDCNSDASATITLSGNNLIEDSGCGATGGSDPNLAPLAANTCTTQHLTPIGMACVQTHALNMGSAAIDGGNADVCSAAPVSNLDQRGITRAGVNAPCEIGAYEVSGTTTAVKLYLPMIVSETSVRSGIVTVGSGLTVVTTGLILSRGWPE